MVSAQTVGFVLLAVGLAALFGAWALVAAGVLLVVVPELTERFL